MKKMANLYKILSILIVLILSTGAAASSALAQSAEGTLTIELNHTVNCASGGGEVAFTLSWAPADAGSYLYYVDFGDGDTTGLVSHPEATLSLTHTYVDQGDYEIYVEIFEVDGQDRSGSLTQILTLEGPEVSLTSEPAPPVFVAGEEGLVVFTATATEGMLPYTYEWDLGGGEVLETATSDTASGKYGNVGEYQVQVTVTDSCGFSNSASMPVVVAEPEQVCHPMAQKIADAVNTLFPEQAGQLYTCEDIYTLFDNETGEGNLGFGRMWMAYKVTETIELSWEDILAWHLDESGWGTLLQLNKFSELMEDQSIGDLLALVMSEEYTINDVRTAVRTTTRYEADFEDALARNAEGATPGELTQFYKLSTDLETDPETLDSYLADGITLAELKHTANFASRMEVDWTEIADARILAESWGDINQAYRLATEEYSAAEILSMGVQEFRKASHEELLAEKGNQSAQQAEEQTQKTAERLAEQYAAEFGDVMNLLNGECNGDWACVRSALRDQTREMSAGLSQKDYQLAQQIASKYGYSEDEILSHFQGTCGMDWACTRTYFRNLSKDTKQTGKPQK